MNIYKTNTYINIQKTIYKNIESFKKNKCAKPSKYKGYIYMTTITNTGITTYINTRENTWK
jgi:hypothetical protein